MDRCVNLITRKFASLFGICTGESYSARARRKHIHRHHCAVASGTARRMGACGHIVPGTGAQRGRGRRRPWAEIKPRSA